MVQTDQRDAVLTSRFIWECTSLPDLHHAMPAEGGYRRHE